MAVYKSRTKQSGRKLTAKQRRNRKRIQYYFVRVLLVGVICVTSVYILHQKQLRINRYVFTGLETIESQPVSEAINIYFNRGNRIIPRDSVLFFNEQSFVEYLQGLFPFMKTVETNIQDFTTLVVGIQEHEASYLARDGDKRTYLVNQEGVIFDELVEQATTTRIFYSSRETSEIKIKGHVLPPQEFMDFNLFLDDLATLGVVVREINLQNELQTILKLENGVLLLIRPTDEYAVIKEIIREILPYKEFGYNFSEGEFNEPIEYINLRYGNKVLYCYTQDSCAGTYNW